MLNSTIGYCVGWQPELEFVGALIRVVRNVPGVETRLSHVTALVRIGDINVYCLNDSYADATNENCIAINDADSLVSLRRTHDVVVEKFSLIFLL